MIKSVNYSNAVITGGIWKEKQKMVRSTSIHAIYDRFAETGRFDALRFDWKEGMPNKPHIFWDSDVAKWIESAAYLTALKKEPKLEKEIDRLVDLIEKNQCEDGYFNIYFTMFEPDKRFTYRSQHELYCAGHLIEAAVAYYEATGKRKFLDLMCKYADYIEERFMIRQDAAFVTPGHEEIEWALIRLYHCIGEKRYLKLAKFFLDQRGKNEKNENDADWEWAKPNYHQSHKPIREQDEAVGHVVRAVYLYRAMAELGLETKDESLHSACEKLFEDIVNKKMYITGGVGSTSAGEAFTVPYDLPNLLAYTESCAAIGLAWFAHSMLKFEPNTKYADVIERILYNGFLSTVSLDGRSFFYENPLEVIPYLHTRDNCTTFPAVHWPQAQRSEVFPCSCCPPNITRFIASVADLIYTDDGETLYLHQYMSSKATITRNGKQIQIEQKTKYPANGKVSVTVSGGNLKLAVRIPGWCESYGGETRNGYAYLDIKDGETVSFDFAMKVRFVEAHPESVFDCGKFAVTKGPIVYCMEGIDNGENLRDIRLDGRARFIEFTHESLGVRALKVKAYRRSYNENTPLYSFRQHNLIPMEATLIPYYAISNRGITAMQVWHFVK